MSGDPLAEVVAAAEPALRRPARPPAERAAAPARHDPPLEPARAFVLEAVREAYLMHYREPRGFAGLDDDLRLLGGDALYALGLARLAEHGDLEGVAELADLISLCARVEAEGRPELAEPLWAASAARLGPGGGPGARATFATLARPA